MLRIILYHTYLIIHHILAFCQRYQLSYASIPNHKACECGAILRGVKKPLDCKLFGTVCTPENPMGSCMVSSEGACAADYTYGRNREFAAALATER